VAQSRPVSIPAVSTHLEGDLFAPADASGVVAFAHGSGSSRHSARNRHVAAALRRAGLATLLFDLLDAREEAVDVRTAELRFDISLLGRRLVAAVDWLTADSQMGELPIGCFGASTGAAAALVAASQRPDRVAAVVSRGGRPDLAGAQLESVRAPTLLIVGGEDAVVVDANRQAQEQMRCEVQLEIVPGAGHLFEEPGALDRVAALAADWFSRHLGSVTRTGLR